MHNRRRSHGSRGMVSALVMLVLIMLVECFVCNAAFWSTLAASTDTDAVTNTTGSGIQRTRDGMLEVVDPTQAYLDVGADGTSRFARVDPVTTPDGTPQTRGLRTTAHLRLDSDGRVGTTRSVSFLAPRSLYLRTDAARTIRVWVQEPRGTILPLAAVRANVRVPFQIDGLRVGGMIILAALVLAWRPGSRLWSIPLDLGSRRQCWGFMAAVGVLAVIAVVGVVSALRSPAPLAFHAPAGYTYDFDLYGHLADSLLHGRLWLDLPTPDALFHADHPYDTAVRERLLAQGVSPIYWDYAWFDGHWYSYFGALPALLIFAPYRLISSWWVPGGAMMPSSAAVILLAFGFLLTAGLLVVTLVRRLAPRASLAATSMALALMLVGSNIGYLILRTNFYSVPFVAAMLLATLGLLLWLSAVGTTNDTTNDQAPGLTEERRLPRRGRWQVEGAPALSLPRLAGGTAAIAATLACRPTFALTSLLGFAIFWPQIKALCRRGGPRWRCGSLRGLLVSVLAPAGCFLAAVGWYNARRFGSPLDFGVDYQMTVTDMTSYRASAANVLHMIGYYLALPLHPTDRFPFLAISPTPLPRWGFTEPMIGGMVMLCPALLMALATPFLRRRMHRNGSWRFLTACMALAMTLIVVDAVTGGLGWRYMADFCWLFALPAIGAMLVMLGETAPDPLPDGPTSPTAPSTTTRTRIRRVRLWCTRSAMLALLLDCLLITLLSAFVLGRDDSLMRTSPGLFHIVSSWFTVL
ncbi:hypothetical protein [Bifidobacterium mongoliense]|nr:hypothetical protein [Bifidobacterium mongoliense]